MKLSNNEQRVLDILQQNGFKGFVVGGFVRDSILGEDAKDCDITTNARPDDIRRIFEKTIDTGAEFGTITVSIQGELFEVTTFRKDGVSLDNRKPTEVFFSDTIEEDLSRRDLTINAIAFNPETGIVDPFNGSDDLTKGIIRTVGNPIERFTEDALRMLRAIRFSAKLGFEIQAETLQGITLCNELIQNISAERIKTEIEKIITSKHPEKIDLIRTTGLAQFIMLELFENIDIEALKNTNNDITAWAILTKGKNVLSILNHFKFDNITKEKIVTLAKFSDTNVPSSKVEVKKLLNKLGKEMFDLFLQVKAAKGLDISLAVNTLNEVLNGNECFTKKDLAISGKDLLSAGIKQGKQIGEMLNIILDKVIEFPELNSKETLLKLI